MLQIAICDDVVEQTLMLQAYIRDYCEKSHAEYKMHIFVSGEELVSEVERFDIVFLDIEMPGLDGIETGREIRAKNCKCRIIMATVMVERMREAFFIEAFRFIVKPFERAEVEEALDACMRRVLGSSNISLFCDRIEYIIHQSEIRYVVTYDSYCEYRVKDKVLRSEDSLKKLEQTLDRRLFFRINRKYIVNMAQVKRYKNGVLHLDDLEISVSRRRKKDFEQAFMEFDLRYR
ncbi:MAG: response regulator transcription factor [Eubacterium sp.]|jgi:DNA-binding LytR/AlgR family response regulator|nr:response regulator transcription factor [Eubacterium sp.]NBI88399.1 DNA-binding response regulator [Lachnospiraceae bacterium]